MDDQSLKNVLAIYRLISGELKNDQIGNYTALRFIEFLASGQKRRDFLQRGESPKIDQVLASKTSSYLLDQFNQANAVIDASQLVDEAKSGVRNAINALINAFQIGNLNNSIENFNHTAPGYISNLVILLSAAGLMLQDAELDEALNLAKEVEELIEKFDDPALDPVVREIAKKHLATLAMLLRHIPIFGLESAMQAYFELMMKLRRANSKSSTKSQNNMSSVLEILKSWGDRIKSLDEYYNSSANMIDRAGNVIPLLQYIPGLS